MKQRAHGGVPNELCRRCATRQVGRQGPAGLQIRKDDCRNVIAVDAGEYSVSNEGREMAEHSGAQRADADPRAVAQLEVFVQTPIEEQPFVDIVRVDKPHRVSE